MSQVVPESADSLRAELTLPNAASTPTFVPNRTGDFQPAADHIHVMTMHASKGLEFPVVALPGVGHMPAPGEPEKDEARLFYVAATRARQRLLLGVNGDGELGRKLTT